MDYHKDCYETQAAGRPVEDVRARATLDMRSATPLPLTAKGVFWAVFGALWAFSFTAGIIYALLRAFS